MKEIENKIVKVLSESNSEVWGMNMING